MSRIPIDLQGTPADQAAAALSLKILIADDHHLVREGLKLSLRQVDAGTEVLEAGTLQEAIQVYREHPDIDLVLLDLSMPGTTGLSALDSFAAQCPDVRVVVVSASFDMKTVQSCIQKGALGFIPKLSGKRTLLSALRFVLDGGIYVPPEPFIAGGEGQEAEPAPAPVAVATLPAPVPAGSAAAPGRASLERELTNRQIDVLRELLQGRSNKQICRNLNLAMGTVKAHVAAVLAALGTNTRAEAIAAADRLGWRQILEPADQGLAAAGEPAAARR